MRLKLFFIKGSSMSLFLILMLFFLYSCDTLKPEVDQIPAIEKSSLEKAFSEKGFDTQLRETINDTNEVLWMPEWKKTIVENRNDSSTYSYVPIIPSLINSKMNTVNKNVRFGGGTKYIIAKSVNNKLVDFYIGTYTPDNRQFDAFDMSKFTGSLLLRNLANGQMSHYKFLDGRKIENKPSSTSREAATYCATVYSCWWSNWNCAVATVGFTSGEIMCSPPSAPCFGAIWDLVSSESTFVCTPTDPDSPEIPILVPNTTPQMINDHFKINAPSNQIAQILNYLKCFYFANPGGIQGRFQIRVVVDQPIKDSNFPVTASTAAAVGHAYLEFTQLNGRGNVEIRRSIGFWPNGMVTPVSPQVPGVLNNDSNFGGSPDVAVSFSVTYNELATVIDYVSSYSSQPYNLMSRNCANMCSDALAEIGINIPDTWETVFWYSGASSGSPTSNNVYGPSVGAYGNVLKNFTHPYLFTKETTGVTVRPNVGSCD